MQPRDWNFHPKFCAWQVQQRPQALPSGFPNKNFPWQAFTDNDMKEEALMEEALLRELQARESMFMKESHTQPGCWL